MIQCDQTVQSLEVFAYIHFSDSFLYLYRSKIYFIELFLDKLTVSLLHFNYVVNIERKSKYFHVTNRRPVEYQFIIAAVFLR